MFRGGRRRSRIFVLDSRERFAEDRATLVSKKRTEERRDTALVVVALFYLGCTWYTFATSPYGSVGVTMVIVGFVGALGMGIGATRIALVYNPLRTALDLIDQCEQTGEKLRVLYERVVPYDEVRRLEDLSFLLEQDYKDVDRFLGRTLTGNDS